MAIICDLLVCSPVLLSSLVFTSSMGTPSLEIVATTPLVTVTTELFMLPVTSVW